MQTGTLYRGRDDRFDRDVMIKVLPADVAGPDLDERRSGRGLSPDQDGEGDGYAGLHVPRAGEWPRPRRRSDIFSLGVILYELVTGRRPFTGDTFPSLMFAIIKEDPGMALIPDGPEWQRLRNVITRALRRRRRTAIPTQPPCVRTLSWP